MSRTAEQFNKAWNEADSCWHEPSHEFGYRCSLEDVVLWQPIAEADNNALEGVLK